MTEEERREMEFVAQRIEDGNYTHEKTNEIAESGLSSRIRTAAKTWGVDTLDELSAAHASGRTRQWRGIGKNTLAELDRFFAGPKKVTKNARIRAAKREPEVTSDLEAINRAIRHEDRRCGPLHERLEFMAMQMATEVSRNYSAGLVVRANNLFRLAEHVRARRP